MLSEYHAVGAQDSSSDWEVIDECVYAFEEDCRAGKRKRLDRYLPKVEDTLRQALLIELVKVDLELQWSNGHPVSLEEYCEQYDALGSKEELPPDLVYEAYRIACQHGKVSSAEQFCQPYAKQRDAVLALAQRTTEYSTAVSRQKPRRAFQVGETFGDFELLALLGEGAFGQVFLSRQISLARQVALKISTNRGCEARTMASLEHDHIVTVFSESVELEANARLLCMQYVPGTNLGKVIRHLSAKGAETISGESIIEAVDTLSTAPAIFQAGALKERELLTDSDLVQAVCWIGARLAEALAYAHQQGVLHRDVKPDNILISQFGRPLLADFNLSLDRHEVGGTAAAMFGGSLSYMSPEHLDAFNPVDPTPPTSVDERSDIFSLGVVLFELTTLRQPFNHRPSSTNQIEALRELAAGRRAGPPAMKPLQPDVSDALEHVLQRCLQPAPDERFQSGAELAEALEAARELQAVSHALPKPNRFVRLAQKHLLSSLLLVALIPNLLGSAVNIAYNVLRIVPQLTAVQKQTFDTIVLGYNLVVYPLCIAWLFALALPIVRWSLPSQVTDKRQGAIRRRVVAFPLWLVAISCLGWLPGGLLFPAALHVMSGPLPANVFGHFAIDFTISGLIALTYSYFGVETILLRALYPQLLVGQSHPREVASQELRGVALRTRVAQVGAGVIPLAGAALLVLVGPDDVTSYGVFRVLVSLLIAVGMLGFCLSISLTAMLHRVLAAVTR